MAELFGDASSNGDWTAVRLRVRGERIVEADADGLSEDLAGLTMLEAAAVDGEELVVEALAAALGPAFRAAPSSIAGRSRDERRRRQRGRVAARGQRRASE